MTFDLHVPQVQGFFDIPSDNLDLIPIYAENILSKKLKNLVFVAPDVGGAARTRAVARVLHAPIAIVDKRRPKPGVAKVEHVVGDVEGKTVVIVDDIIDTAGTITGAASILKKHGAKDIYVLATHAVLSGPAVKRLKEAPIKEILITDTIELPKEKSIGKIRTISIAPLLAETIKRQHEGTPMGEVYDKLYEKVKKKTHKK